MRTIALLPEVRPVTLMWLDRQGWITVLAATLLALITLFTC
jgi:hypothetical protein